MTNKIEVDPAFLREQAQWARQRADRFKADAQNPPPVPTKKMSHPGGRIRASNPQQKLHALLLRKIKANDTNITQLQRRALCDATHTHNKVFINYTIALTAGGSMLSQSEFAIIIRNYGGTISNTIHKRVDFVLASQRAMKRRTQKVRKAEKLGILLVDPTFIHASIAAGEVCDPTSYPALRIEACARDGTPRSRRYLCEGQSSLAEDRDGGRNPSKRVAIMPSSMSPTTNPADSRRPCQEYRDDWFKCTWFRSTVGVQKRRHILKFK